MLDTVKLSKLMKEYNITSYRDLDNKVGLKKTTLYNMLDEPNITISNILKLAKYFNVLIDDLNNG